MKHEKEVQFLTPHIPHEVTIIFDIPYLLPTFALQLNFTECYLSLKLNHSLRFLFANSVIIVTGIHSALTAPYYAPLNFAHMFSLIPYYL